MASLSIDVVVPTFNRFDLTARCLRDVAAQTRPCRLIVADDGSTDGSPQRVAALRPDAVVVRHAANGGGVRACNAGVAAGDADVVVLVNNDVECRPEFLERLVAPLERDAAIGSVAALCVRPDGRHIDSVGLTADVTLSGFPRLHGRPLGDAAATRPALTGPTSTAAAYRRAAWEQLGGFDEGLSAYVEDLDLALRLRAAGWGAAAATDAIAMHHGSATFGHRSARQRRLGGFGRGYVLRRYTLLRGKGSLRVAATEAVVVLGDALLARDLAAARGRIAGWRAAASHAPRSRPPHDAIDASITMRDALALRRVVYCGRPAARS